jgi:hypothetical protein
LGRIIFTWYPLWYSKHQQRKATNIKWHQKIFFTKNYSHFVQRCSGFSLIIFSIIPPAILLDLLFCTNNLNVLFAKNHLQSIQRIWLVLLPTFFKSPYKQARIMIGSFRKFGRHPSIFCLVSSYKMLNDFSSEAFKALNPQNIIFY